MYNLCTGKATTKQHRTQRRPADAFWHGNDWRGSSVHHCLGQTKHHVGVTIMFLSEENRAATHGYCAETSKDTSATSLWEQMGDLEVQVQHAGLKICLSVYLLKLDVRSDNSSLHNSRFCRCATSVEN